MTRFSYLNPDTVFNHHSQTVFYYRCKLQNFTKTLITHYTTMKLRKSKEESGDYFHG